MLQKSTLTKKNARWPWVLGSAFILVLAAGVGVWQLLPWLVLRVVTSEALKHDIELSDCQLVLGRDQLLLKGCALKSRKQDLQGTVALIVVTLEDWSPVSLEASKAELRLRSVPEVRGLLEQNAEALTGELPLRLGDSQLSWYPSDADVPLLKLTSLNYDSGASALSANLESPELLNGTLKLNSGRLDVHLRLVQSPETQIRVAVQQAALLASTKAAAAEVDLSLENLALEQLNVPLLFEVPEELKALVINGRINATFGTGLNPKAPSGSMDLALSGLHLPVPKELEGLRIGPNSQLSGKFVLDHSYKKANLKTLTWSSGALTLKGSGKLEQSGLGLQLDASLQGNLSCQAIAQSAAQAHLTPDLLALAAKLGRRTIQGGVGIQLDVSAHSSRLSEASVNRRLGVGCGLKPASIEGAVGIAEDLLDGLPKLKPPAIDLPDLDLDLTAPGLKLPKFEITLPELPKSKLVEPAPSQTAAP